ncbi:MAG: YggS family pyridoxal phosphate-dependent enzyme [Anaerolineales bacterium]|jgi:hypothetical protein|nr:YggS family pyridoxal phosphate-dependent enzyme [Anaerolineaceae bacterium]MDP6226023.1 YggS family pyridoxal phosphate-dependent enzyme [Anaerolineales bacterium]MDP7345474.1 YggS family pyridoxal phosphate-dependent enzyme [Anaerolineales bacterium]MDP7644438.1 YggS family pyridoxal phosphate-dependent enzyme [Anaerolineales bacterium]HJN41457.1 YggS family pyridoxal phosphate-dependent enzyme [Anaerolineales bacterium]|tara:strand:- start:1516 stop:2295 length:780 start_codon:yes stop_codon:yes gene_type:complete
MPVKAPPISVEQVDSRALALSYAQVRDRAATAARRAGRVPEEITIVAVSKARPLADVEALFRLGHRNFGENRVEEGSQKALEAAATFAPHADPIIWNMIGHIQSRKAKTAVAAFAHIHSLDSVRLAQRLSRFAAEQGKTVPLLLECNVSAEASKHGFVAAQCASNTEQWAALTEAVTRIMELPRLEIRGLMTMAPIVPKPEAARPHFRALRDLRDRLAARFPAADWEQLSMGMTDDFEVAIEEGATLLRIGRAIFGERS